nr:MAG TPA: hypothetical protein [Caudoviricetes sp.]
MLIRYKIEYKNFFYSILYRINIYLCRIKVNQSIKN